MEEIGVSETLIPCFDHPPDNVPRAFCRLLLTTLTHLPLQGIVFEARKADHKPHGKKIIDIKYNGKKCLA